MSDTVDKVIDAAENAMRARGYHAVSFRELADEIGIKSASVHYHFPKKDDLGVALIRRYTERLIAELDRRAQKSKGTDSRLDVFINVYRDALVGTGNVCLCVMLGAESRGLPSTVSSAVAAFLKVNIDWLVDALPDSLPRRTRHTKAASILATLQGAMMMSATFEDHSLYDAIARDLRTSLRQK